jgi:hypothetical protein
VSTTAAVGLSDGVVAGLLAQRDLLRALDEHTKTIAVRVTSPDRTVCVEVDAYGSMTDFSLSESAYRGGADHLAAVIVATARKAADIAMQRQEFLNAQYRVRADAIAAAHSAVAPARRESPHVTRANSSGT